MRVWFVGVAGVTIMASACGDDGVAVDGGDTTGSSTGGETTFSTLDGSSTSTDGPTSTSSPTTTTTADTSTSTSESESSSTGEPTDPFGDAIEIPLAIDFDPLALAIADIDGDGALDLLVTGTLDGVVTGATLLGDGTGGFAAPIDAGVTACSAFPITGAVDDDGRADLFFGTCGDAATFYLGESDGTFTAVDVLDPWEHPPVRSSRFVDHDDDGDDDLVLLTVDDVGLAQLHLALHEGAGAWPITTTDIVTPRAFEPNGLGLADLDGENGGDVLLVDVDDAFAFMVATAPVGHGPADVLALDIAPSSVVAFDVEGDGLDDMLIGSRSDGAIQFLANFFFVAIASDEPILLPGVEPLEIAVGRFDGDEVGLAILDADEPSILAMQGDGRGGFAALTTRTLPSLAVRLLTGDLDDNGRPDLIAATFAAGSITIFLAE